MDSQLSALLRYKVQCMSIEMDRPSVMLDANVEQAGLVLSHLAFCL